MGYVERLSPLKEALLNTEFTHRNQAIRKIATLQNKIVRADDYNFHESGEDFTNIPTEDFLTEIEETDEVFAYYKGNNVAIPNYERIAFVRWNSQPVLYTLVDRIEGKNLEHDSFSSVELREVSISLDRTYAAMLQIADYVFFHGGSLLNDLRLDQLVWGRAPKESKSRVYYVDVEPGGLAFIDKYNGNNTENSDYFFDIYIGDFIELIQEAEVKMKTRMRRTRRELHAFAEQFDNTVYERKITEIIDKLYVR